MEKIGWKDSKDWKFFSNLLRLDTEQDRLGNMKRGSHMHCEFWMQMDWDRMRNRLGYGKARSHVHCGFGHMPLDRKLFWGFHTLNSHDHRLLVWIGG